MIAQRGGAVRMPTPQRTTADSGVARVPEWGGRKSIFSTKYDYTQQNSHGVLVTSIMFKLLSLPPPPTTYSNGFAQISRMIPSRIVPPRVVTPMT